MEVFGQAMSGEKVHMNFFIPIIIFFKYKDKIILFE